MPLAISIHVGVDNPGPDCCPGDRPTGSEVVAQALADLAETEKFQVRATLTGARATYDAVTDAVRDAARELNAEAGHKGILFLSFTGHGCQVPSLGGVLESDRLDETWCLADRSLRDNEIHDLLKLFEPGIRVLVITESCHSGGSTELPADRLRNLERLREEKLLFVPAPPSPRAGGRIGCPDTPSIHFSDLRASVLVLAASAENQKARPGLFTGHLLDVWRRGFTGTYCEFINQIDVPVGPANPAQKPTIYMLGPDRPTFVRQRPFTIDSDLP
jgi:metacaspase-1